jgi:hypothetical protein
MFKIAHAEQQSHLLLGLPLLLLLVGVKPMVYFRQAHGDLFDVSTGDSTALSKQHLKPFTLICCSACIQFAQTLFHTLKVANKASRCIPLKISRTNPSSAAIACSCVPRVVRSSAALLHWARPFAGLFVIRTLTVVH